MKFRGFRQMVSFTGEKLMHPDVAGRIKIIRENCGFRSAGEFDAFWKHLNEHLRQEWPEYEDDRRLNLFRRALEGEKITKMELIGPHQEISDVELL